MLNLHHRLGFMGRFGLGKLGKNQHHACQNNAAQEPGGKPGLLTMYRSVVGKRGN